MLSGLNVLEFSAIMLAFGVSAIVPGLDFAMVLKQSIAHGRATAIATSIGIGTSVLVHGTYTIFGIGLIVSQSILFFNVLKFAGAAYLIYIGISAIRAPAPSAPELSTHSEHAPPKALSWSAAFIQGFLTNLLNPKAVLFFVALFSTLVSSETSAQIKGFYVLNMSVLLMAWFSLVSIFFTLPNVRAAFFRAGKWFNRVTGVAFISLAISMVFTRQH